MPIAGGMPVGRSAVHLFCPVVAGLFLACSAPPGHPGGDTPAAAARPVERLPADTVIHLQDSAGVIRYGVFVPRNLDTTRPVPVVLFADPDGDGDFPLVRYKVLAERFGMVFAGSHNARNGQPLESNMAAMTGMLGDLQRRLRTDSRLLLVAGFSGGARTASFTALQTGAFAGVLAAGAGMVQPERTTASSFHYVAMAARGDFNYTEMVSQRRFFRRTGLANDLLVYAGRHEWPPVRIMERALNLVLFSAMRKGTLPRDIQTLHRYGRQAREEADTLRRAGRFVELAWLYEQALQAFAGTADTASWSAAYSALLASPGLEAAAADQQKREEREKNLVDQYVTLLGEKDATWWRNEMKMLNARASDGERFEAESYSRIVAYLQLAAYLYCNQYLKAGDYETAWRLTTVYAVVDPENPEPPFLQALILVRRGLSAEAVPYLRHAASLGHKNRKSWRDNPDFASVNRTFLDSLAKAP